MARLIRWFAAILALRERGAIPIMTPKPLGIQILDYSAIVFAEDQPVI